MAAKERYAKSNPYLKNSSNYAFQILRDFIQSFSTLSITGVGSSGDPCSNVYRGTEPEEAPCVKAFANVLRCNKKRLHAYFSLHSFFQLLLTPNSYTPFPPADNEEIVSQIFMPVIFQIFSVSRTKPRLIRVDDSRLSAINVLGKLRITQNIY